VGAIQTMHYTDGIRLYVTPIPDHGWLTLTITLKPNRDTNLN